MDIWIQKNNWESIKITNNNFKGKDLLDIRICYYDKDSEEYKPTKKGVSIPYDKIDELKQAIDSVFNLKSDLEE